MVNDYLITVESTGTFGEPEMVHRLIEVSEEFMKGFYAGIVLCYPKNRVYVEKLKL